MSTENLKDAEEAKRVQAVDPLERWMQLQRSIDWAIESMPPSEWKIQRRLRYEFLESAKRQNLKNA